MYICKLSSCNFLVQIKQKQRNNLSPTLSTENPVLGIQTHMIQRHSFSMSDQDKHMYDDFIFIVCG